MIWLRMLQVLVLSAGLSWDDDIAQIYTQHTEISQELYPPQAVWALVAVESCGKTKAHKGKYRGALQLGPAYLKEAGASAAQAMTRRGALHAWARVQRRYQVRRAHEPVMVLAIFHKGGPGVLKTWRRKVAKGKSYMKAAEEAARKHKVAGMTEFLRRFDMALTGRAPWCGEHNKWLKPLSPSRFEGSPLTQSRPSRSSST